MDCVQPTTTVQQEKENSPCALLFCENERFKVCSVEVENVDTGNREVLCIANGTFSKAKEKTTSTEDKVCSSLYVKDRFSVLNEAFHELSMVSDLPTSFQVKKMTKALNSKFEIRSIGTIGVQQSLRTRLAIRLTKLVEQSNLPISSVIRVKLTGDGTQIARGLTVVNIAFTILEEGQRACSASGNHSIAILKVSDSYDELAAALEDICAEAKYLEVLTIKYKITLFLGGVWKFFAA